MQRILSTACVVWSVAVSADPLGASIEELQAQLSSATLSSVDLVDWYVRRIEAYDQQGPALNAIQHMNDNARAQAQALDDERGRSGPRSLLHGIPILAKDNYETIDAPTTAGSAIIEGHWPPPFDLQRHRAGTRGSHAGDVRVQGIHRDACHPTPGRPRVGRPTDQCKSGGG